MENKQDKGFTLVELLIVIVILGILATVTVFAVRGITDQGQKSACATDKETLQTAIEAFIAQNGRRSTAVTEALLCRTSWSRRRSTSTSERAASQSLTPPSTATPARPHLLTESISIDN